MGIVENFEENFEENLALYSEHALNMSMYNSILSSVGWKPNAKARKKYMARTAYSTCAIAQSWNYCDEKL